MGSKLVMLRDELITELLAMPANADVAVSIGHNRIDLTGVAYDAERDQIVFDLPPDDMQYALERIDLKAPSHANHRKTV